ncbi:MAG TPA: gamma-glutamyl-gamma-aminobutyrate hydrolase family protein [Fimbriimonadales bacterium]|nr:gamma-glutamyl-gamma-aminobutyrate hydrolase family protein [Fimbriimonadales bacterium]
MKPKIFLAITKDPRARLSDKEENYKRHLEECGAEVIPIGEETDIGISADGLVIMGGPDIDPTNYGQENVGCEELLSHERFDALKKVFEKIKNEKKPILGICMGMQFLNVMFGGDLEQDMGHSSHREGDNDKEIEVAIEPNTLLHKVLDAKIITVNCSHHQRVRNLGKGLRIAATANDGTIEEIEHPEYPFLIGVQWHPERTPTSESRKLFEAFVSACSLHAQSALR